MVDNRGELRELALLFDVLEEGEENDARDRFVGEQKHLVDHRRYDQIGRFAETVAHFVHDGDDLCVVHVTFLFVVASQTGETRRAMRIGQMYSSYQSRSMIRSITRSYP